MPTIHFNGKTYSDMAEMSATERQAYEQLMSIFKDKNQDGVPDIFQGDVVSNIIEVVKKSGADSEGIAALEQMSPAMRARISKGVAKLQEFGLLSGMPDLPYDLQVSPSWEDTEIRPSQPIVQPPSAIQEDSSPRWILMLAILVATGICVAGVAVFIILRAGF